MGSARTRPPLVQERESDLGEGRGAGSGAGSSWYGWAVEEELPRPRNGVVWVDGRTSDGAIANASEAVEPST